MKSHRNVTPRQEALAERNLCAAVAALRTAEECRAFFRDLCTPAELQAMADRWAVVDFLKRGVPYREIHRLTGVSVTTIGRVARFLGNGNGGYEIAAKRLGQIKRDPSAHPTGRRAQDSGATGLHAGEAIGQEPAGRAEASGTRARGTASRRGGGSSQPRSNGRNRAEVRHG